MSYGVGHKEVHREEAECHGESKKGIHILGDLENVEGENGECGGMDLA